jgi:hypothetical protein
MDEVDGFLAAHNRRQAVIQKRAACVCAESGKAI